MNLFIDNSSIVTMVDVDGVVRMSYKLAKIAPTPEMRKKYKEMGDTIRRVEDDFRADGYS